MRKVLRLALPIYAVIITALVVLAATIGPFQESYHLWTRASLLESQLKQSQNERSKAVEERDRILAAMKKLQNDWNAQQENIKALRELTKNPEMEQRLVEANALVAKNLEERAVLISKLNELQQEIQACENEKKKNAGNP